MHRPGEQFAVAERTPLVEHGSLDGYVVEGGLEGKPEARRYPDIGKDLHSEWLRSGLFGAGGVLYCRRLHGCATDAEDRCGRPWVDFEIADEVVERYAISEPVEQLLDGQTRAAEARRSAHSTLVDPHGLFQGHCLAGPGFCARLHRTGQDFGQRMIAASIPGQLRGSIGKGAPRVPSHAGLFRFRLRRPGSR